MLTAGQFTLDFNLQLQMENNKTAEIDFMMSMSLSGNFTPHLTY